MTIVTQWVWFADAMTPTVVRDLQALVLPKAPHGLEPRRWLSKPIGSFEASLNPMSRYAN